MSCPSGNWILPAYVQMPGHILSYQPLPERSKWCSGAHPIHLGCQVLPNFATQCCVNVSCDVPKVGSGYCRSVKNNGCSGGKFHAGFCPGDSDIKCCVKVASPSSPPPPPPPAPAPNPCTAAALDKLLFQDSMSTFTAARNALNPSCFDWSSDGCSCSPDDLGEYDFLPSCKRHDFGYRNLKNQKRFDEATRKRVDDNLRNDLYNLCNTFSGWQSYKGVECRRIADVYYAFVRKFGKKKRDNNSSSSLQKRSCDLGGIFSGVFWSVVSFMFIMSINDDFFVCFGRAKFEFFLDIIFLFLLWYM